MEQQTFVKYPIWLRNVGCEAYLRADDDGQSVSVDPEHESRNSVWYVDMVSSPRGTNLILQGAAYGRYLAATDPLEIPGQRCFRAEQSEYDGPQEMIACQWWISRVSPGSRLNVIYHMPQGGGGRLFLRAHGVGLRWNEGVTVEETSGSSQMHWGIMRVPVSDAIPPLPFPSQNLWDQVWRRQIRFVRAGSDGFVDETAWETFHFLGRSVFSLRSELAQRMGEPKDVQFTMCVRAGRLATITVLVVDLPRSHDPMDIVILSAHFPVHAVWYPNFIIAHRPDRPAFPDVWFREQSSSSVSPR